MFFTQQTSCLPHVFLVYSSWYIGIYTVDTLLYSLRFTNCIIPFLPLLSIHSQVFTWVLQPELLLKVVTDMLTFLGRLHRYITYQFSLVEYVSIPNVTGYPNKWFVIYRLKVLLFMLIWVFEFELAVSVVAKESQPQSSIAEVTSEHCKFLGLILSVHQSLYIDIRWVTSHRSLG